MRSNGVIDVAMRGDKPGDWVIEWIPALKISGLVAVHGPAEVSPSQWNRMKKFYISVKTPTGYACAFEGDNFEFIKKKAKEVSDLLKQHGLHTPEQAARLGQVIGLDEYRRIAAECRRSVW